MLVFSCLGLVCSVSFKAQSATNLSATFIPQFGHSDFAGRKQPETSLFQSFTPHMLVRLSDNAGKSSHERVKSTDTPGTNFAFDPSQIPPTQRLARVSPMRKHTRQHSVRDTWSHS